jgi:hypothetical protein
MFTRSQVEAALPKLFKQAEKSSAELLLKAERLEHNDFEEGASFCRGQKADFRDAIQFWFWSLQIWRLTEEQWLKLIESAKFKLVQEAEFYQYFDSYMFSWVTWEKLPLDDEFIQAIQIDDEWNEVSVVAEFKTQYIFIYWATGG